jgi:hypothetical protein
MNLRATVRAMTFLKTGANEAMVIANVACMPLALPMLWTGRMCCPQLLNRPLTSAWSRCWRTWHRGSGKRVPPAPSSLFRLAYTGHSSTATTWAGSRHGKTARASKKIPHSLQRVGRQHELWARLKSMSGATGVADVGGSYNAVQHCVSVTSTFLELHDVVDVTS